MAPRRRAKAETLAEDAAGGGVGVIPDECLVEVFRSLGVHLLLTCARVSMRWRRVAQDAALWRTTRFSSIDTDRLLTEHFRQLSSARNDQSGAWTRCERKLGRLRLMCRSVNLDYVEPGEGVSYRLLRSISCLQQLDHPTIVPLLLVNVDVPRNSHPPESEGRETPAKSGRPASPPPPAAVLRYERSDRSTKVAPTHVGPGKWGKTLCSTVGLLPPSRGLAPALAPALAHHSRRCRTALAPPQCPRHPPRGAPRSRQQYPDTMVKDTSAHARRAQTDTQSPRHTVAVRAAHANRLRSPIPFD
jgi:hypothetical protein